MPAIQKIVQGAAQLKRCRLGNPEFKHTVHQTFEAEAIGHRSNLSGFGQAAIFEVMEITDEIRTLIHNNAGAHAIKSAAIKKGMRPLRSGAIEKVKAGMTTCEEVLRVTGELREGVSHTFKSKISVN